MLLMRITEAEKGAPPFLRNETVCLRFPGIYISIDHGKFHCKRPGVNRQRFDRVISVKVKFLTKF